MDREEQERRQQARREELEGLERALGEVRRQCAGLQGQLAATEEVGRLGKWRFLIFVLFSVISIRINLLKF